jgi:hypothetical protein
VWIACTLAFSVTLLSILVSILPPGDAADREVFLAKVVGTTLVMVLIGLFLYWRGRREKRVGS